jgi:hypothetical protein
LKELYNEICSVFVRGSDGHIGRPSGTGPRRPKLDGDDISITASGGDIGPAAALVVVDATSSKPLFHYLFPSSQTAGDGTPFNVTWNASGIATWTA